MKLTSFFYYLFIFPLCHLAFSFLLDDCRKGGELSSEHRLEPETGENWVQGLAKFLASPLGRTALLKPQASRGEFCGSLEQV